MQQLLFFDSFTSDPGTSTNQTYVVSFQQTVRLSSIQIVPGEVVPFPTFPDLHGVTKPDYFSLELFLGYRLEAEEFGTKLNVEDALKMATRYTRLQDGSEQLKYEYSSDIRTLNIPTNLLEEPANSLVLRGNFEAITLCIYGEILPATTASTQIAVNSSQRPVSNKPVQVTTAIPVHSRTPKRNNTAALAVSHQIPSSHSSRRTTSSRSSPPPSERDYVSRSSRRTSPPSSRAISDSKRSLSRHSNESVRRTDSSSSINDDDDDHDDDDDNNIDDRAYISTKRSRTASSSSIGLDGFTNRDKYKRVAPDSPSTYSKMDTSSKSVSRVNDDQQQSPQGSESVKRAESGSFSRSASSSSIAEEPTITKRSRRSSVSIPSPPSPSSPSPSPSTTSKTKMVSSRLSSAEQEANDFVEATGKELLALLRNAPPSCDTNVWLEQLQNEVDYVEAPNADIFFRLAARLVEQSNSLFPQGISSIQMLPDSVRDRMDPSLVAALLGTDQSKLLSLFMLAEPGRMAEPGGVVSDGKTALVGLCRALQLPAPFSLQPLLPTTNKPKIERDQESSFDLDKSSSDNVLTTTEDRVSHTNESAPASQYHANGTSSSSIPTNAKPSTSNLGAQASTFDLTTEWNNTEVMDATSFTMVENTNMDQDHENTNETSKSSAKINASTTALKFVKNQTSDVNDNNSTPETENSHVTTSATPMISSSKIRTPVLDADSPASASFAPQDASFLPDISDTDDGGDETSSTNFSTITATLELVEQQLLPAVAVADAMANSSTNGDLGSDQLGKVSMDPQLSSKPLSKQLLIGVASCLAQALDKRTATVREIRLAMRVLPVMSAVSLDGCAVLAQAGVFARLASLAIGPLSVFSRVDILRGLIRAVETPTMMHTLLSTTPDNGTFKTNNTTFNSQPSVLALLTKTLIAGVQPDTVIFLSERIFQLSSLYVALERLRSITSVLATQRSKSTYDSEQSLIFQNLEAQLRQLVIVLPPLLGLIQAKPSRDDHLEGTTSILTVLRYMSHHHLLSSLSFLIASPKASEEVLVVARHVLGLILRCPELRLWIVVNLQESLNLVQALQLHTHLDLNNDEDEACSNLDILTLSISPSWAHVTRAVHASIVAGSLLSQLRQPFENTLLDKLVLLRNLNRLASSEMGKQALVMIASVTDAFSDLGRILDTAMELLEGQPLESDGLFFDDVATLVIQPAREFVISSFGQTDLGVETLLTDSSIFNLLSQWPGDWPYTWNCQHILEPVRLFISASGGIRAVFGYIQRQLGAFPIEEDSSTSASQNTVANTLSTSTSVSGLGGTLDGTNASTTSASSTQSSSLSSVQQLWQALLFPAMKEDNNLSGFETLDGLGVGLRILYWVTNSSCRFSPLAPARRTEIDANLNTLGEIPVLSLTANILRMVAQGLRLSSTLPDLAHRSRVRSVLLLSVAVPAMRLLYAFLDIFYSDGKIPVQSRIFLPAVFQLLSALASEEEASTGSTVVNVLVFRLFSRLLQLCPISTNAHDVLTSAKGNTVEPMFSLTNSASRPLLAEVCAYMLESPQHMSNGVILLTSLLPPPPSLNRRMQDLVPDVVLVRQLPDSLLMVRTHSKAYRDLAGLQLETFAAELGSLVVMSSLSTFANGSALGRVAHLFSAFVELGRPSLTRSIIHILLDVLVHLLGPHMTSVQTMIYPRAAAGSMSVIVGGRRVPAAAVTAALNSVVVDDILTSALRSLTFEQAIASSIIILFVLGGVATDFCGQTALRTLRMRAGIIFAQTAEIMRACWASDGSIVSPKGRNDAPSAATTIEHDSSAWTSWAVRARDVMFQHILVVLQSLTDPSSTLLPAAPDQTCESEERSLASVFQTRPFLSAKDSRGVPLVPIPQIKSLFSSAPSILFPFSFVVFDIDQFAAKHASSFVLADAIRRAEAIPGVSGELTSAPNSALLPSNVIKPSARLSQGVSAIRPSRRTNLSRPASRHVDEFNNDNTAGLSSANQTTNLDASNTDISKRQTSPGPQQKQYSRPTRQYENDEESSRYSSQPRTNASNESRRPTTTFRSSQPLHTPYANWAGKATATGRHHSSSNTTTSFATTTNNSSNRSAYGQRAPQRSTSSTYRSTYDSQNDVNGHDSRRVGSRSYNGVSRRN